jgi:hypothetical protein
MKRYLVPAALLGCVAISIVMAILKPIPHAHLYGLSIKLSLALAFIWMLYAAKADWLFKRSVLAVVLLAGLALGVTNLKAVRSNSEIVRVYGSVFKTIDSGRNPYTSGSIIHLGEQGQPVYGNFNYPPMEIYPYYLAYRTSGTWNAAVLTTTMLLLHALCCLIFLRMFPEIRPTYLIPYFLLFLLGEIRTNPSMTFLVTALTLWLILEDRKKPRKARRYLIAVLFGVGLATKFLIIPLMAAYYWHQFDPKKIRSLGPIVRDGAIALATAVLVMAPFGLVAVFKNTILFNLVLKDRAALTTFYPNALSGPASWLGLGGLYPFAALAILGLSILAAPMLSLFSAMLAASYTFLLVAPTPESQFLPIILFLVLTARCETIEEGGPVPSRVWKRLPVT